MSSSRTSFVCASCTRALRQSNSAQHATRSFSTTIAKANLPSKDEPRWKQTPPAMRMPFRLRQEPKQPKWSTNTQQEPVDEAFDNFIGTAAGRGVQGRDVLPEEIKVCTTTRSNGRNHKAVLMCIPVAVSNPQILRPRPPPFQRQTSFPRETHTRSTDLSSSHSTASRAFDNTNTKSRPLHTSGSLRTGKHHTICEEWHAR